MPYPQPVTPQGKIIKTADKFGNNAVKYQQGTTRVIYDTLPISGATDYRFFENANSRQFPFTNVSEGKLNPLETLTIMRLYLAFIEVTPGDINDIVAITNLDTADANFQAGQIDIKTAESTIAKRIPINSFMSEFNKSAEFDGQNNFQMDTLLTLQPELEYTFQLRIPTGVTVNNTYVRLVVEGVGTLIAPKATF